jgi:hypothetical protein
MHPSITEEDILDLPRKEHFVALLAVARSLGESKKAYASMKDIRLNCEEICGKLKLKPISDIEDYVQASGALRPTTLRLIWTLFKRVEAGLAGRR